MEFKIKEAVRLLKKAESLINEASSGGGEDTDSFPLDFTDDMMEAFDKAQITIMHFSDLKRLQRAFERFKKQYGS
jgi:hypothetical protein